VSAGATAVVGGAVGLVIGTIVAVTTDLPLAPEVGVALGALAGWFTRRDDTRP
jgi:hypothetical protein